MSNILQKTLDWPPRPPSPSHWSYSFTIPSHIDLSFTALISNLIGWDWWRVLERKCNQPIGSVFSPCCPRPLKTNWMRSSRRIDQSISRERSCGWSKWNVCATFWTSGLVRLDVCVSVCRTVVLQSFRPGAPQKQKQSGSVDSGLLTRNQYNSLNQISPLTPPDLHIMLSAVLSSVLKGWPKGKYIIAS